MDKYIYMMYLSFKSSIMYRSEVLLKIIHTVVILSVQVFLWKTLYMNEVTDTELSLRNMITYLILSSASGILLFDQSIISEIGGDVRNGGISVHLSRPFSYIFGKCSHIAGRMLFLLVFTVIPMFILSIALFGFSFPQKGHQLLLTLLFTFNAYFIFFILYFMIGLSSFWFMEVHGAFTLTFTSITRLLSGAIVPLWYFPGWLKKVADVFPVRLGFDLPLSIYFGRINSAQILQGLLIQIIWLVSLCLLNYAIWKVAVRRLVIQGG